MFAVSPAYQSKGIGTKMIKWGTDLADRLNAEVSYGYSRFPLKLREDVKSSIDKLSLQFVVLGSPKGTILYQKHGFEYLRDSYFKLPEKYASESQYPLAVLLRHPMPAKATA